MMYSSCQEKGFNVITVLFIAIRNATNSYKMTFIS